MFIHPRCKLSTFTTDVIVFTPPRPSGHNVEFGTTSRLLCRCWRILALFTFHYLHNIGYARRHWHHTRDPIFLPTWQSLTLLSNRWTNCLKIMISRFRALDNLSSLVKSSHENLWLKSDSSRFNPMYYIVCRQGSEERILTLQIRL